MENQLIVRDPEILSGTTTKSPVNSYIAVFFHLQKLTGLCELGYLLRLSDRLDRRETP